MELVYGIITLAVTCVVLGILYKRMIDREKKPVDRKLALIPLVLGGVSVFASTGIVIGLSIVIQAAGYQKENFPVVFQMVFPAFCMAAFPEELVKMLVILIVAAIFKSRIKNVYEYVLIGAAVGFGFTVTEEFAYSADIVTLFTRLPTVAAHMIFNMIMAEFFGMARYNRSRNESGQVLLCILAFVVPVTIHTLYDACTAFNPFITKPDDQAVLIGGIIAVLACLMLFTVQVVVLVRFKKNAEKLCGMEY